MQKGRLWVFSALSHLLQVAKKILTEFLSIKEPIRAKIGALILSISGEMWGTSGTRERSFEPSPALCYY